MRAGVLAPLYFRLASEDDDDGGAMGEIGLLNYAWELDGVQIGLLNYARNNRPGLRLLPIFSRNWD